MNINMKKVKREKSEKIARKSDEKYSNSVGDSETKT